MDTAGGGWALGMRSQEGGDALNYESLSGHLIRFSTTPTSLQRFWLIPSQVQCLQRHTRQWDARQTKVHMQVFTIRLVKSDRPPRPVQVQHSQPELHVGRQHVPNEIHTNKRKLRICLQHWAQHHIRTTTTHDQPPQTMPFGSQRRSSGITMRLLLIVNTIR